MKALHIGSVGDFDSAVTPNVADRQQIDISDSDISSFHLGEEDSAAEEEND